MSEGMRIQSQLAADLEVYRAKGELITLRAENARLRGVLAEIQFDCEHIGGIQHLDKAERRTWMSVANRIKAALTPAAGGTRHHVAGH